jgi:hypothetical protein
MSEHPPNDEKHYDSRTEEIIDWYQHYMSIQREDLIAEYTNKKEASMSLKMAAKERIPQIV